MKHILTLVTALTFALGHHVEAVKLPLPDERLADCSAFTNLKFLSLGLRRTDYSAATQAKVKALLPKVEENLSNNGPQLRQPQKEGDKHSHGFVSHCCVVS